MSVRFLWDNEEETRLRFIFDELWQLNDLQQAFYVAKNMLATHSQVIDVLIDMSACQSIPSNLSDIRQSLQLLDKDKTGVMVFITQDLYIPKVMQLLNQILHHQFTMYFTDSLNEARQIAQRATITREHSNG